MALAVGATVGRYRIQGLLGSGGMGEVYKAVDPVLTRPVALKVLRSELSGDRERLSRFLQEARAASALNHPNILTIHEVGDHDDSRYLVSEFVDGETLRQRIARGSLTLRDILDIAIQAASALSAAHAAGIVHRDIKPDNLMVRPDGYVKVLDFGVATFARQAAQDAHDTMATMAQPETGAGMIVGTIAYMSPEQARGLNVDGRSDCYSLGVVLYELVTGQAPFSAPTTTDLLVAILEREPPSIRTVARGLPLQLEWIIDKALEKDPNLRYQTIADLRVDLQRLKAALESGRLAATANIEAAAARADAIVERELTEDSEEVSRIGRVAWPTWALTAASIALLAVGMTYYTSARPGADLPLELPEGAVVTKARDVVESFGYGGFGTRTSTQFNDGIEVDAINAAAGLDAVRQAVREGAPVAQWRASITHTASPSGSNMEPAEGDYTVRLDPRGQMMAFATGYAKDGTIAHTGRAAATTIGLDAIKKAYGVDASPFELEFVERSFPAGKTEMTWRGSTPRFGYIDQYRVNLQGSTLVLIEHTLQRPRDYKAPDTPMAMRIFKGVGPAVMVGTVVIGWIFGLYFLFKTKNWDALTRRMPLAMCALVLVQVGLGTFGSNGVFESAVSIIAIAVLLVGMVLPALSGVMLWINRRNPASMWAAEQLTRGRFSPPAVSVSIFEGAAAGAAVAGILVLADWLALQVPGFDPTIKRELDVVDASMGATIGNALSASAFIVLGFALALETGDRWRLPAWASGLLVALSAGFVAASDQDKILPALVLLAGGAVATIVVIWVYRVRGFLAAWIAGLVTGLLNTAMAARSFEDADLQRRASMLITLVVVIAAAGAWGVGRRLRPLHPSAKLGIDRG